MITAKLKLGALVVVLLSIATLLLLQRQMTQLAKENADLRTPVEASQADGAS